MQPLDWTAVITKLYWPLFALLIAAIFQKPLSVVLTKRKLSLQLPNNNAAIEISTEDAEKTLTLLFTEFYFEYSKLLKPWHKMLFEKILNTETKLHVNDLIPGFDEENREHKGAMRALRGLGLIEPKYGGEWVSDSIIEVTRFGQVLAKHLKLKD